MVEIDSSPGLAEQKMEGRGMWEQERRRGEGRLVQTSRVLHCCIQPHCSQVDVDVQLPTQPHWHGLGWGRVKRGDAEPPPPPLQIPHTRLPHTISLSLVAACLEWRLRTIRILLTINTLLESFLPWEGGKEDQFPIQPCWNHSGGHSFRDSLARRNKLFLQLFLSPPVCGFKVGRSCQPNPIQGYMEDNKETQGTNCPVVAQVPRSLGHFFPPFRVSLCLFVLLCPGYFSWPLFQSEPKVWGMIL